MLNNFYTVSFLFHALGKSSDDDDGGYQFYHLVVCFGKVSFQKGRFELSSQFVKIMAGFIASLFSKQISPILSKSPIVVEGVVAKSIILGGWDFLKTSGVWSKFWNS